MKLGDEQIGIRNPHLTEINSQVIKTYMDGKIRSMVDLSSFIKGLFH